MPAYVPRTRRYGLVLVVLGSFALVAWVTSPLWVALVLGVVLAISAQRPHEALVRKLGERRSSWAAAIVSLSSGVLLAGLLTGVFVTLSNELMKIVGHINTRGPSGSLVSLVGERGVNAIERLGVDTARIDAWIHHQLANAANYAASLGALVLRTTSSAVLGLIVALVTMYYVLVEGANLARRIERVAPLEPRHTRALLAEAREVGRQAFVGTVATAAIQGVLAGVGYAFFDVPEAVTWAVATAIASLFPLIGTALVWAPVCVYLITVGHPARAVLLLIWCLLIVTSLADYVIRPWLVGGRGRSHPLLMLIAVLGGIEVLGLAGLIVAPIVMSVFVAAFRLYEREVSTAPGDATGETSEPVSRS